jgi:hypothetical protein
MVHGPAVRVLLLGIALLCVVFAETRSPGVTRTSGDALYASAVVSLHAAVAPNPDNTLAAQLAAKEAELALREAALGKSVPVREAAPSSGDKRGVFAPISYDAAACCYISRTIVLCPHERLRL